MPELVLCSTSPYRKMLLERLALPFRCRAPRCDEAPFHAAISDPRELAERLALEKVVGLQGEEAAATLIGSDQVAAVDGEILTKPGSHERAREQLGRLAGHTHVLITALCVWRKELGFLTHTDVTHLTMRPLDAAQIERYLQADQPYDCVGCYKLEAAGIGLFAEIRSNDHTAITGLPMIALVDMLARCGHAVP